MPRHDTDRCIRKMYESFRKSIVEISRLQDSNLSIEQSLKAVDVCSSFINAPKHQDSDKHSRSGVPLLPEVGHALKNIKNLIKDEELFKDPVNLNPHDIAFNAMSPAMVDYIKTAPNRSNIVSSLIFISNELMMHYGLSGDEANHIDRSEKLNILINSIINNATYKFPDLPTTG